MIKYIEGKRGPHGQNLDGWYVDGEGPFKSEADAREAIKRPCPARRASPACSR